MLMSFSGMQIKAYFKLFLSIVFVVAMAISMVGQLLPNSVYAVTVCEPNLIQNPCLEDQTGEDPSHWFRGNWGTNIASFLFPTIGESGNGAQVDISDYTDGDAKWYFDDVTVTPGQSYEFSDSYFSETNSKVVARYTLEDGSYVYHDYGYLEPTSVWERFTYIFQAINDAVSLTIFHLIDSVGSLNTDNFSLITTDETPMPLPTPLTSTSPTPVPSASATPTPTPEVEITISSQSESTPSDTSVTITWDTNHPATSRVVYDTVSHLTLGASPSYDYAFSTVEDSALATNHSVGITGLTPNTTYFYRVVSHGSPEVAGPQGSFTTSTSSSSSSGGSGGSGFFPITTATPSPSSSPSPSPSGSPVSTPSGTPLTTVAGISTQITPTQGVAGAMTQLPETSLTDLSKMLFSLYTSLFATGVLMLMIGYGILPKKMLTIFGNR